MERFYQKYKSKAEIFIVYIREAHPEDGWQSRANSRDGVLFTQPKTFQARCSVATAFLKDRKVTIPCLLDDMNATAQNAYSAWPERIYVIDIDGKIARKGNPGPWGFSVSDAEKNLEKILANKGKMTDAQKKAAETSQPTRRRRRCR